MNETPSAAIWWRVSTDDQRETSPEAQIREALTLAESEGFNVPREYVLGTNWHSLSVSESPPMERLRELIRSRSIGAVYMYDADRGPSKPAHRLLFRALCEEHGVQIRCRYGQVPDGEMGEVMEFLSAWQKEKQVHRAQRGARDGLRDRVRMRGLPANGGAPYGLQWNGEAFVPSDTYPVAQGIWRMLVEGKTDRGIAGVLTRAGIPTPSSGSIWNPCTIASIATNRTYSGRVIGLRWEGVEPKTRRKETYGKSATKLRRQEDTYVLEGLVEQPIVSSEEFEEVQERRARNKAGGGKRVRNYLLSGLVICGLCGRRYSGTGAYRRRFSYGYRCGGTNGPIGAPRCRSRLTSGPELEEQVWHGVRSFLEDPDRFFAETGAQEERNQQTVESIRSSIDGLEHQIAQYEGYKHKAYDGLVRGVTDEETYHRVVASYNAHEAWLREEIDRQRKDLEHVERRMVDSESVRALYPVLTGRLERATFEDKRFVLDCLGTRVMVAPDTVTLELAIPGQTLQGAVSTTPGFSARESEGCPLSPKNTRGWAGGEKCVWPEKSPWVQGTPR